MNKILCDSNKQIRFKKQIILQTNRLTIISVVELQPKLIKNIYFATVINKIRLKKTNNLQSNRPR